MSESEDKATLEDFALKGMHFAKMTGVSVAAHAIPDAFLLMHSGVGCKYKTAAQVGNHDWGSHPNKREAWTQVAELQLIKGSSARIGPFARAWYERRRPSFMPVVSAYFIELTGEDFSDAVRDAEATVPCDMALIKTSAPNKGFYDGYASVMLEVAERMDWSAPVVHDKSASVMGFFFHRYEPDQHSDIHQLRSLLKAGGLDMGPVLFSGQPYPELLQAPEHRYVVHLPYTKPKHRKFKRLAKKRENIECDLPIGLEGTRRFVRTVASASGADMDKVEAWLEARSQAAREQMNKVNDHFRNLEVAIFADTPLAAGLVSLMRELGIHTPIVGLRDTKNALGGRTEFFEILARSGVTDFDDMEVVAEPSLRWTRQRCTDGISSGRIGGVIASSHEIHLFTNKLSMAYGGASNAFLLETGFPSDNHHVTYPTPTLGFAGCVAWAQRILDGARSPRMGAEARGRVG